MANPSSTSALGWGTLVHWHVLPGTYSWLSYELVAVHHVEAETFESWNEHDWFFCSCPFVVGLWWPQRTSRLFYLFPYFPEKTCWWFVGETITREENETIIFAPHAFSTNSRLGLGYCAKPHLTVAVWGRKAWFTQIHRSSSSEQSIYDNFSGFISNLYHREQ